MTLPVLDNFVHCPCLLLHLFNKLVHVWHYLWSINVNLYVFDSVGGQHVYVSDNTLVWKLSPLFYNVSCHFRIFSVLRCPMEYKCSTIKMFPLVFFIFYNISIYIFMFICLSYICIISFYSFSFALNSNKPQENHTSTLLLFILLSVWMGFLRHSYFRRTLRLDSLNIISI